MIFLIPFAILFYIQLSLFQLINFFVHLFQFRITCSPEVITVRSTCNLRQCFLINFNRHTNILYSISYRIRIRRHSIRTNPDGIHTNSKAFCYFSSRHRRNITFIVSTVCQQNNDFRFCFTVFQSSYSICYSHTYGSTIFNKTAFDIVNHI